jgi:capsular exopolysaccharide synthesis family protein
VSLQRYIETLKERRWLILAVLAITVGAAIAYVTTAAKVYKADAQMLVTPVSSSDQTFVGLGLIRDSNDPTRDVSTAAQLVTNTDVAARVKRELHLPGTPTDVLKKVEAAPIAQSNLVTVTAQGPSPGAAQRLANAFARQTVADRTERLHAQLDAILPPLRARVAQLPAVDRTGQGSLGDRLAALETLRAGPDPTLKVQTLAARPDSQSSPRPKLTLAAGIVSGLILGIVAAFGLQALDPRLRREEQLRELYGLPILSRIPRDRRGRSGRGHTALAPERLAPATHEAFRTLRAMLAAMHPDMPKARSVLVTSASPGEGKTTVAINLAHALAQAGSQVTLVEADLRRPTIGPALGLSPPRQGTASVLIRQVPLDDALVVTEKYGPDLQLLLAEQAGDWMVDRLSLPTARQIVADAEATADFVVIDSAPLTEVIDALPLAREVDDVLLVARLGKTNLRKLSELGELLAQNDITPVGIALVGVERTSEGYYYVRGQSEPLPGSAVPS